MKKNNLINALYKWVDFIDSVESHEGIEYIISLSQLSQHEFLQHNKTLYKLVIKELEKEIKNLIEDETFQDNIDYDCVLISQKCSNCGHVPDGPTKKRVRYTELVKETSFLFK